MFGKDIVERLKLLLNLSDRLWSAQLGQLFAGLQGERRFEILPDHRRVCPGRMAIDIGLPILGLAGCLRLLQHRLGGGAAATKPASADTARQQNYEKRYRQIEIPHAISSREEDQKIFAKERR